MTEIISVVQSTFDDRDRVRLAFFSLFQRVIDVEILVFMGMPQLVSLDGSKLPWAVTELTGIQQVQWNDLARRAQELHLVTQTEDGLWLIENRVANGLRSLIPLSTSTEPQRVRAFVESNALSARRHFERVKTGDSSAERQIRMNEANYLSSVSLAASSNWPGCILDTLLGLQVIYRDSKRLNEWRALIESVVPIFTEPRTGDALPGMDDMWLVMTSFELGVLLRENKWREAYPRQAKVVEKLEQAAMPWSSGIRQIDNDGFQMIRRLASELSKLGEISKALGNHDTASQFLIRSRHLMERGIADDPLVRAERMLKSVNEAKIDDEQRRKLIKDGISIAEESLKSADPNNNEMLARIYFVLGSLQRESELFDQAIRSYEEILFIRKATGDQMGSGRAEGNIGGVLEASGRRRKALESFQRAVALFEQAGEKGKEDLDYTRKAIESIESELSNTTGVDVGNDGKRAELNRVIRSVVASIRRGDLRGYIVILVGYFVEGYPYPASALGVSSHSTPDIHLTEDGFACTCFFSTRMLQPSTVKNKQIMKTEVNGAQTDLVAVGVEVKFDDIYMVGAFWDGKQHDLYIDLETSGSRTMRFMRETGLWFERRKAE